MSNAQVEGRVLKNYSGFYYVQDHKLDIHECKVRGKLKDKILTGDRVRFTTLEDGKGILESIVKRDNELYRPKVANVSLVLIVMAYDRPRPSLTLLDRLLFLAEYSRLTPCIVLNKCDLSGNQETDDILNYYPQAGFSVVQVSARNNIGMQALSERIKGEIAVLAGPSGAGKSSLLNNLTGQELMATQEVSNKIGRGRHTTRHVQLYPMENGACLVDTPGFSVLDIPRMRREELTHYFSDFNKFAENCKFADCIHNKENECGVKTAVSEGAILTSRYEHYLAMLEEVMERERCY